MKSEPNTSLSSFAPAEGPPRPGACPVNALLRRSLPRSSISFDQYPRRISHAEFRAIVRCCKIELGAEGNDPARIDIGHAAVIAELDPGQVDGLGDARHLVEVARVIRQIVVVGNPPQIAFEVRVIDRVEP